MGVVNWKQVDVKEEGESTSLSQQGCHGQKYLRTGSLRLGGSVRLGALLFHDPLALKLQACRHLGMFKFSLIMNSTLTSLSHEGPHCTLPHTNLPWTVGWGPIVRTRTPLAINSAQTSDEGATSPTELVQPNANH